MARKKKDGVENATATQVAVDKVDSNVIAIEQSSEVVETPITPETILDNWGRAVPTTKIRLESVNYNTLVDQVIVAGTYGAYLNPTKEINVHYLPFFVHILIPEENYTNYLTGLSSYVVDLDKKYNRVSLKATDRILFFTTLLSIAREGAAMAPNTAAMKTPTFSASLLTRAPVATNFNVTLGPNKVTYTPEELESFDIKRLTIIGKWYNLSFKSKEKYIKGILENQTQE